MKPCIRCTALIEDDATVCQYCGTNQNPALFSKDYKYKRLRKKENDAFLIVLCVLTILGALSGLITFFFGTKLFDSMYGENVTIILTMAILVNVGKLSGAIFMLLKKRLGLYIYTAFSLLSIVHILLSKYLMVKQVMPNGLKMPELQTVSTLFSIFIQLAFVVMYWLKINRKLLS